VDIKKTAVKVEGLMFGLLLVVPTSVAFLMWLADGTQRVGFADAHIISVRYIAANLVFMALLLPVFYVAKNRAPGTPLTWGEAMVAALYTFFVLFWLYGVVPHEFLTWADAELGWRPDKKIIGPEGSWASWFSFWKKIPLTVHKQTVRDIFAVHIYTVGLGGFMWICKFWNNREQNAAAAKAIEPTSRYGRPLVAKAGNS